MPHSEGSFIRWQSTAITQMGYAVNLILTLATASLGFTLQSVKDHSFTSGCWDKCCVVLAGLCLLVSVGLGIWCVINRLIDFRKTKDIARVRETLGSADPDRTDIQKRLDERREETKRLGRRTWVIFWWQVGTFGAGVLLLVIAVAIAYSAQLFGATR